jgi:hypothetical protein
MAGRAVLMEHEACFDSDQSAGGPVKGDPRNPDLSGKMTRNHSMKIGGNDRESMVVCWLLL